MINPNEFSVNTQMEVLEKNFLADQLKRITDARGESVREFAGLLKWPYQTVLNYSNGSRQPGWEFLKALHDFGINLDWFVSQEGEMYRANRADHVRISYSGNGVAVHQNNGSIGVADASAGGGRSHRICEFVQWWMENRSADDQAWLEQQLARAVPEYLDWKKGAGR